MLSILEKRVNNKISKIIKEKNKISSRLNDTFEIELEINELLDAYEDIKKSKKYIILYFILNLIFTFLISIHPIFTIGMIYMIIALCVEKSNINENKKFINSSEYKYCKNKENLEEQLVKIELRKKEIKKLISIEVKKIKKYQKLKEEIEYVRSLENNINDENFNLLKDLYSAVPVLAFNTKNEYDNYLSYDNEFIKDEIIKFKIL